MAFVGSRLCEVVLSQVAVAVISVRGIRGEVAFYLVAWSAVIRLIGLAVTMTALIVARVVQGLGAGAVQPMSVTIVGDIYSLAERAKVQGYIASVWAIASGSWRIVSPTSTVTSAAWCST